MKSASASHMPATASHEQCCRQLIRQIITDLGKGVPTAKYGDELDQAIAEAEQQGLARMLEQLRSAKQCIAR